MAQGKILTIVDDNDKETMPMRIMPREHLSNDALLTELGSAKIIASAEIRARKTIEKEDKVLDILNLNILQLFSLGSLNITKSSSVSSLNQKLNGEPLQLFSLGSLSALDKLIKEFEDQAARAAADAAADAATRQVEEAKARAEAEERERAEAEETAKREAEAAAKARAEAEETAKRAAAERAEAEKKEKEAAAAAAKETAERERRAAERARRAAEKKEREEARAAVSAAADNFVRALNTLRDATIENSQSLQSESLLEGGINSINEGIKKLEVAAMRVAAAARARNYNTDLVWSAHRERLKEADIAKKKAREKLLELQAALTVIAKSEILKNQQRGNSEKFDQDPNTFKTQVSKAFQSNFGVKLRRTKGESFGLDITDFIAQLTEILLGRQFYNNNTISLGDNFQSGLHLAPLAHTGELLKNAAQTLAENIANSIDIPMMDVTCRGSMVISEIEMYIFMKGHWNNEGDNIRSLIEAINDDDIPRVHKGPLINLGNFLLDSPNCASLLGAAPESRANLERTLGRALASPASRASLAPAAPRAAWVGDLSPPVSSSGSRSPTYTRALSSRARSS